MFEMYKNQKNFLAVRNYLMCDVFYDLNCLGILHFMYSCEQTLLLFAHMSYS